MSNENPPSPEERDPDVWNEAHHDEQLYALLMQQRALRNRPDELMQQSAIAGRDLQALREGYQNIEAEEIMPQIRQRLIELSYPEDDIR